MQRKVPSFLPGSGRHSQPQALYRGPALPLSERPRGCPSAPPTSAPKPHAQQVPNGHGLSLEGFPSPRVTVSGLLPHPPCYSPSNASLPPPYLQASGQVSVLLTWESSGGPSSAPSCGSQRHLHNPHKQMGPPLLNTVHRKLETTSGCIREGLDKQIMKLIKWKESSVWPGKRLTTHC